jgi:hypothetical protein
VTFTGLHEPPSKARPLQFGTYHTEKDQAGQTLDLDAMSSASEFLRQKYSGSDKAKASSASVASFRRSEMAQYIFYISSRTYLSPKLAGGSAALSLISLADFLETQFHETLSVVQQYNLALELARTVLQFHSTP